MKIKKCLNSYVDVDMCRTWFDSLAKCYNAESFINLLSRTTLRSANPGSKLTLFVVILTSFDVKMTSNVVKMTSACYLGNANLHAIHFSLDNQIDARSIPKYRCIDIA